MRHLLLMGVGTILTASDIAQEGAFLPIPSRPAALHAQESLPLVERAQGWYAAGMSYAGSADRLSGGTAIERDSAEPLDAQVWLHLLHAEHGHPEFQRQWLSEGARRSSAYLRVGSDPRAAGYELDMAVGAYATSHGTLPTSVWLELGRSSDVRGSHLLAQAQLCVFEVGLDLDEEQTTWTYGLGLRWPGGAAATTPGTAPWMLHGSLHGMSTSREDRDEDGLGAQVDAGVRLWNHVLLQGQLRWVGDALTGDGEDDIVQAQLGIGATF